MAQSLKVIGLCLLGVTLAGCGIFGKKTSAVRQSDVMTIQERADAAYRSNDMGHAASLYLKLTKLAPKDADNWYMLGNAYVRTQQPDNAVQAYQQAIARNPNHSRAWHNLGMVRMRQAMAAFVSSASTAQPRDPMRQVSTQLADELARIGLGSEGGGQSQPQVTTTSARVNLTRSTARRAASASVNVDTTTSKASPSDPYLVRRKPGGSTSTDEP
jgi:predicted Zn-dependent protease